MSGEPPPGVAPFEMRHPMPEEQSHVEQGQVERAKRLRDHIDRLKEGKPQSTEPNKPKSLKEQIEERATREKK